MCCKNLIRKKGKSPAEMGHMVFYIFQIFVDLNRGGMVGWFDKNIQVFLEVIW